MITLMHLPIRRGNAPLRIAHGHFATNHSHINYFVDITYQKTRLSEAKDSAHQLVSNFVNDTPVDTILCLDGTSVLGTCVMRILWIMTIFRQSGSFEMLMDIYPITWVITGAVTLTAYFIIRNKEEKAAEQRRKG